MNTESSRFITLLFVFLLSFGWVGFIQGVNYTAKLIVPEQDLITYHHDVKPAKVETVKTTQGTASWYDYDLEGVEWSKTHDTCASRTAKRYSTITVENLDNGKKVDCFVNDYGPELWTGREIDLSSHAFAQLAPLGRGLINVRIINK